MRFTLALSSGLTSHILGNHINSQHKFSICFEYHVFPVALDRRSFAWLVTSLLLVTATSICLCQLVDLLKVPFSVASLLTDSATLFREAFHS